jgi:FixJ family two-component response regulator
MCRCWNMVLTMVRRRSLPSAVAHKKDGSDKKLAVTVVNDDASVCKVLNTLLLAAGWSVLIYGRTEELLASSSDGTDCLILDIDLPDMSGLELLQRLALSEWREIPIIFLTSRPGEGTRTQTIHGPCAFLPTTVSSETLLRAVNFATKQVR